MIAESTILIILNSYIFSWSDVIIESSSSNSFFPGIKTLEMVSNNEEKYFSRVCMKARSVEVSLLAAA